MDIIVFQLVDLVEKIRSHHASRTSGTASSSAPISGSTSQAKPTDAVTRNQKEAIRNSPAVKFLTRTDFFSLVQYSDVS